MTPKQELLTLANLWCEDSLSGDQLQTMQNLLRSDAELRTVFLRFLQLHGQLAWDGGNFLSPEDAGNGLRNAALSCCSDPDLILSDFSDARSMQHRASLLRVIVVAACTICIAFFGYQFANNTSETPTVASVPVDPRPAGTESQAPRKPQHGPLRPLEAPVQLPDVSPAEAIAVVPGSAPGNTAAPLTAAELDDKVVIARINELVEQAWEENAVQPAPQADDFEWIRRLSLVLTGAISSSEKVTSFVDSDAPAKREELVLEMTGLSETADNLAGIWTNLLIGRSVQPEVDRVALRRFLRRQFAVNDSWMDTVGRLIAAEGRSDQQGETNFLLAHLNAQATPATAVAARLFLGHQVHCTQCHDHPFDRDRAQHEFWALNAFFKTSSKTQVDDSSVWILDQDGEEVMTFFENLRGEQIAVMPEFAGESVRPGEARRSELARLLAEHGQREIASAMVNRVWSMFFGYGFTNPIDDLGPHNPASHPELFAHLTDAFIQSDFDIRRLMRWVALSRPFGLSSIQSSEIAGNDQPERGGIPLFSRSYSRPLGPEQVYDSLHTAFNSVAGIDDLPISLEHRADWVRQFVLAWSNDENEETLAFDCNLSQALLMMNNHDLEQAIPRAVREIPVDNSSTSDARLNRIAMATLNREPTDKERTVFRSRLRALTGSMAYPMAIQFASEDMLWAYLNSAEFSSVH